MSSKDTFFKVKTGLGVGTDTLYASTASQKVSIGKTEGKYTLDVVGDIRTEANVLVENRIGVGTTAPFTDVDVRGIAIVSEKVGIGTTLPKQSFQVNSEEQIPVVITGFGSFGVNVVNPTQRVQIVGSASSDVVVVTGVGSVGIGTLYPLEDFHFVSKVNNHDIVIDKTGQIGVNLLNPSYDVDINGDLRVIGVATIFQSYTGIATVGIGSISEAYIGFATVGFATIFQSYTGIATVGIGSISEAYIGFATVGFATIDNSYTGIGTIGIGSISEAYIGFATINNSYTGIGTIGIGSISEAYIGFATVGFATIDNSYTGIGTIGIGSISEAYIGFATVGFATINNSYTGITTISREFVGISSIDQLFVSGITTTVLLDVGVGATLATFKNLGITSITSNEGEFLKNIQPIVGISTTAPTRTLDIAGDLRVRGEIIDSNNNVGYGYSVLGSQALGISGRFIDAANLLLRNRSFIQEEVVGFITSTNGPFGSDGPNFDYGLAGIDNGPTKCKRDIGLIIDAIAFDISKGGNSQCVGAGLSYYNGVTLSYLDDTTPPPPGFSPGYVKVATIAGISSIAHLARYIVNNSVIPISHQSIGSSVSQLIDTEIIADGDSNTNPNGCANVVSAIYSCVGIVNTIINGGPSFAPNINYPAGKLTWQPPGARIGNEWFVNKLGDDSNRGSGPGDAFLTIKKAASIAQPGDTIRVYAGLYIEDGPIVFNERVAIVGEDLRRTLVTTRDKTDLFYVKRGCYVAGMSFVGPSNPGKAMVSFPTQGFGYADGTEENWQSPYVQNCTNFVPDSIGMRIDGNRAGGFKSMVLDAYTQYNQGGIGVSITNFGYAQLVSLFTICCDIAVYTDTGGVCDLNNSNSSFGNFGLWSNGSTPLQYTGEVIVQPEGDNVSSLTINVGIGASQEFIDAVRILRSNKDYIASEVVGFITSTSFSEIFPGVSPPFPGIGSSFDYGGSEKGRDFCRRDSKIIIEQICSDVLSLGNKNSIDAGLAYRDSADGSLTYLGETTPPPVGFNTGYVKDAEISAIKFIAGISTYIVKNEPVPFTFQSGVGTFSQVFVSGMTTSSLVDGFISNRAGIITSIIGIGTSAVPSLIIPKGQRPYDGQIAIIDTQYYTVSRIEITNPGFGYDPTIPVEVTIDLPPNNEEFFIPAEAAIFETNINPDGTISSVDVIVSGTGYGETPPTVTIAPPDAIGPGVGTTATAVAVMDKIFFNPISATSVSAGGTTTVVFDEFVTYSPLISVGSTVYFYQSSKIIASSITFEYIGTGINIVNAIPSKGAVPIDENQIVATNGGKVPFTSTDQSGDFRISEGITINQNTGTISGQAFSKSLQAEVTPLIIALQQ